MNVSIVLGRLSWYSRNQHRETPQQAVSFNRPWTSLLVLAESPGGLPLDADVSFNRPWTSLLVLAMGITR